MKEYRPESEKENKIPCTLVQDLLPLYIEELTSAESARLLQDHLASCEDCQNREALLRSSADAALQAQQREDDAELNYLKKIRRSGRRKLLLAVAAMLVLLIAICGTAMKLYVTGTDADYSIDIFNVDHVPSSVTDNIIYIKGHIPDKIYCGYKLVTDSEGNDNLKIIARRPLPWESDEDIRKGSTFELLINTVDVNGHLTTPEYTVGNYGAIISQYAKDLYNAGHEYIGDASANQALAELVINGVDFGKYESELDTGQEPYIWTLHFTEPIKDADLLDHFERIMPGDACLLLTLVQNLDEVRWTYLEKTKDGNVEHEGSMNIEEATFYTGTSYIKDHADSPQDIQTLLNKITEARYKNSDSIE